VKNLGLSFGLDLVKNVFEKGIAVLNNRLVLMAKESDELQFGNWLKEGVLEECFRFDKKNGTHRADSLSTIWSQL